MSLCLPGRTGLLMKHLSLTLPPQAVSDRGRVKLLIFCMPDVCGRLLRITVQPEPCALLPTKRSGGQMVSRTFRCSFTMPRQATYYRCLGRGPMSLDDSTSDAFSRILHTFRFSMATVQTSAKNATRLWELGRHTVRAQSFCLKEKFYN